jgi:uncharacterized protein YpmB
MPCIKIIIIIIIIITIIITIIIKAASSILRLPSLKPTNKTLSDH